MNPLYIIEALRKTDRYIEMIFLYGSCYQFHLFLKAIFSNAVPYINKYNDHIISKIGNEYYDITGIVSSTDYREVTSSDLSMLKEWGFGKYHMIQVCECPICEEPILI